MASALGRGPVPLLAICAISGPTDREDG